MSKLGVLVIKPDAVQEGLLDDLLSDITDAGFRIVARKEHWFTPDQIPLLCSPKELAERRISAFGLVNNYISGESVVLIIEGVEGTDGTSEALRLKGKVDGGGLRAKYFPYSQDELDEAEKNDLVRFGLMKARNRIHSPDSFEEALEIMRVTFTPDELEELSRLGFSEIHETNKNLTFK
jgi:nucleoside diphosphate kinase